MKRNSNEFPHTDLAKAYQSAPQFRFRPQQLRRWGIVAAIILLFLYFHRSPTPPAEPETVDSNGCQYPEKVDWSQYAYSQYATNSAYLCNSLMVFDALERYGSRADRILFYPDHWDLVVSDPRDRDSQLLVLALRQYNVKLIPVKMASIRRYGSSYDAVKEKQKSQTWDHSINKFLAWNQTQYKRILHLDSDITLLKHLDDLFFLPSAPVAMPRAYWAYDPVSNPHPPLTSLLVLLEPSTTEYNALMHLAETAPDSTLGATSTKLHPDDVAKSASEEAPKYDMELLNQRYGLHALVLPHRRYALLTGEFRQQDHGAYLGPSRSGEQAFDPYAALAEAHLVHFSDWPLPKPWIMWPRALLPELQPACAENAGTATERGCEAREVWKGLYDGFRARRKEVCALLSAPAPEWPPRASREEVEAEEAERKKKEQEEVEVEEQGGVLGETPVEDVKAVAEVVGGKVMGEGVAGKAAAGAAAGAAAENPGSNAGSIGGGKEKDGVQAQGVVGDDGQVGQAAAAEVEDEVVKPAVEEEAEVERDN